MASEYDRGIDARQKMFDSLMSKFDLSDEDMSVENVQKLVRENAAAPVLFWDHDPWPSHDTIWTSDFDFADPVGSVDFPTF